MPQDVRSHTRLGYHLADDKRFAHFTKTIASEMRLSISSQPQLNWMQQHRKVISVIRVLRHRNCLYIQPLHDRESYDICVKQHDKREPYSSSSSHSLSCM